MTTPRFGSAGPKVYVVSLARAKERREAISEQLSRYGVDFTFVDAVDAKEVEEGVLRSLVDQAAVMRSMKRQLSAPEIACALSHRLVYKDIVASGYPGAVVLEDDAILTPLFVDSLGYFRHIEREIENRWIIYNLEVMSRRSGDYLVLRRRNAQTVNENLFFAERVDWISVEAHGTAGYYITARAARNMVSEERISASADIWSFHARRGNGKIFVSVPCSVLHPPDQSTGYLEEKRRMEELRAHKERGAIERLFRYIRGGVRARVIKYIVQPAARQLL